MLRGAAEHLIDGSEKRKILKFLDQSLSFALF